MESGLKVKIVKKIEDVSAQEWKSVFPDVLENYYFFKTLDESNFRQFTFFYILVYDQDILIGATSCFIMDFPLDIVVSGILKKLTGFIKSFVPRLLIPRTLICGLPMGQGRIGIKAQSRKVIQAITEAMDEIARQQKAGIIAFKDFIFDYKEAFDPLLEQGFFGIGSLPSTDMDITFASFDEYLKSLSSVTRSGLKRKFKEIDGKINIDLEVTSQLKGNDLQEVYALYLQTYARSEIGLEKLTPDFFEKISKNMPHEVKFFLWRMNHKIVAFALCMVSGDYFIDYYLGFDYGVAYQYHLYYVRFRDLMKWCIENNIKKYEMGSTAYEPKRRLNFNFIPLYIYAKHRNKFFNPIFKGFCHIVKPANFDPVFKELKITKAL